MRGSLHKGVLVVASLLVPSLVAARPQAGPAAGGGASSAEPPAGPPSAPSSSASTAPSAEPAPTSAPPSGYGYRDHPAPRRHHAAHVKGPVATLPGFEMLPDGGSRLFVQLTQSIEVAEKKGASKRLVYVLKGAHIAKTNNENPLVTVHFNTPVVRARLLPRGKDLHFVVDLRADVAPTMKVVPAKEGSAIVQIDFPKGDYLGGAPAKKEPKDATKPSS